jgi:hypothetical protein
MGYCLSMPYAGFVGFLWLLLCHIKNITNRWDITETLLKVVLTRLE